MTRRAGGARLLAGLLLFALLAAGTAPLGWDLPEPRSRTSKIRVHPRGNLWATAAASASPVQEKLRRAGFAVSKGSLQLLGHFMGKKSLEPPSPSPLGAAPHISLRDQSLQLSHDLLRILSLKKALGISLGDPASHTQEAAGANTAEVMQIMG